MRDFMNHRAFEVTLGRKLNFITGANGAGKSAIVAALQLCLGVSARKTGRAENQAGMIRHGSEGPAIVAVTLLNEGPDAFKPDEYGTRITVERTISRSGTATYALKDKAGRKVTGERRELESMLRTFNIYCDNPCNVLTQEESKRFIQGKEEDKYKFFLKATGIDRTMEELAETDAKLDTAYARIKGARSKLRGKEDNVKKLEGELEVFRRIEKFEKAMKKTAAKALWVDVELREARVEACKTQVAKLNKRFKTAESNKSEMDAKECNYHESNSVSPEQIEEAVASLEKLKQEHDEHQKAYSLAKEKKARADDEIKSRRSEILRVEKQAKSANVQLMKIDLRAKKSAKEDEKQLIEDIANLNREVESLEQTKANTLEQIRALDDEKVTFAREKKVRAVVVSDEERSLKSIKSRINALSGGQDIANLFHPKYDELLQVLRKRTFKGPWSEGPAGAKIKIKEEFKDAWLPIETALGKTLETVFVTTVEDQRMVSNLMRSKGMLTSVTKIPAPKPGAPARYRGEKITGATTVADCITCDDDLVFNGLCEQANILRSLVIANEDDYKHFTDASGNFLRGVTAAFDAFGTKVEIRNGNKQNTSVLMGNMKRPKLEQDLEQARADAQQELSEATETLNIAKRRVVEHEAGQNGILDREWQLKRVLHEAESRQKALKRQAEVVRDKLNERRDAESVDTTHLENEIRECKEAIESMNGEMETFMVDVQHAKDEEAAARRRMDDGKAQRAEQKALLDDLMLRSQNFIKEREKFLENQRIASEEVEKYHSELEQHERTLVREEEKLTEITNKTADATLTLLGDDWNGEPLSPGNKTKEDLHEEHVRLEKKYNVKKQEVGLQNKTKEVTECRLDAARVDLAESVKQIDDLKMTIDQLLADSAKRRSRLLKMRQHNSKTVKNVFNSYLRNKKMRGKVVFDHEAQTLGFCVATDMQDDRTVSSDVRNMSGGERSYVTLCLLLALGHVIECPFRLMDEYDVFMDQITRKTTLKQIQQYAIDPIQNGRQFIVITPQDLSGVKTNNDVRVHRIKPPVRDAARGLQQRTVSEML